MERFIELVEGKTDSINFELYPNGQIGDIPQVMKMIQNGDIGNALVSSGSLTEFIREFGVFDLPFMISNFDQVDSVLDGPFAEKMRDRVKEKDRGFVIPAFWENGFKYFTNSKRAIESVDDFKGIVVRVQDSQVSIDTW